MCFARDQKVEWKFETTVAFGAKSHCGQENCWSLSLRGAIEIPELRRGGMGWDGVKCWLFGYTEDRYVWSHGGEALVLHGY